MKCPLCNNHNLVAQSLEDICGALPDIFCPEVVKMPGGKVLNHYRANSVFPKIRMIVLPYRVLTERGISTVSILSKYKSGKHFFKTLFKVPEIHPDTEDKLRERIKLLLLLS
jgi:hypothetical protein